MHYLTFLFHCLFGSDAVSFLGPQLLDSRVQVCLALYMAKQREPHVKLVA